MRKSGRKPESLAVFRKRAYALILSICYKSINLKSLWKIIVDSAKMSGMVVFLIGVSNILGWVMAFTQIPDAVATALLGLTSNKYVILLIMNVILLVAGTFMDVTPAILIFTPLFLPICRGFGMDPIQFGLILVYTDQKNPAVWGTVESVSSWTWPGFEGKPCVCEVYADANEVELFLNDKSLGRRPVERYKAFFDIVYQPGELRAVAYRGNGIQTEYSLVTVGAAAGIAVQSDRTVLSADGQDLSFITISVVDGQGRLHTAADKTVRVTVEGPGVLQGLGSANPCSTEGFAGPEHRTFEGRLLAVVRAVSAGVIQVVLEADGQRVTVELNAV